MTPPTPEEIAEWMSGELYEGEHGILERCPDGGTCHHYGCADGCFRVAACAPLSGVFPGDWPATLLSSPGFRPGAAVQTIVLGEWVDGTIEAQGRIDGSVFLVRLATPRVLTEAGPVVSLVFRGMGDIRLRLDPLPEIHWSAPCPTCGSTDRHDRTKYRGIDPNHPADGVVALLCPDAWHAP